MAAGLRGAGRDVWNEEHSRAPQKNRKRGPRGARAGYHGAMKRFLLAALLTTAALAGAAHATPRDSFGQTYFANEYLRPSP